MRIIPVVFISIAILFTGSLFSQDMEKRVENLSREEMQSVMEFLAHDLLEGRGPGTRGGNLGELYMKSIFKFMGLQPGFQGKYLQPFNLKAFTVQELDAEANSVALSYPQDIVGTYTGQTEEYDFEADAVYVGFGISAPTWKWDDYGAADVRGKFIITRVNDPGLYRYDKFEGKTLTYYGRWIYHIEEAARRGAAGILMIHTDMTAGYDWTVVKNSWSGEEVYLPEDVQNNLVFRGWIKERSMEKVLKSHKMDLKELYRLSLKKRFKPIDLGFKIRVKGKSSFREVVNNNVVAHIPGKSAKRIVLSAHIDHHGMNNDKGDNILNGAIDNGTAVAAMVMSAKILKEFQDQLHYSVTILACNAEEGGMLGSKYYARNTELENIITNINFESTPVWEKANSIMGVGARFSTLEDLLMVLARQDGLAYSNFSLANQGFFYRSDQFSFARFNIPSLWISAGEDDDSGERKYIKYWTEKYHTVKDEYDPSWPLDGFKQTVKYTIKLIDYMNQNKIEPRWKRTLTFPLEPGSRANPPNK